MFASRELGLCSRARSISALDSTALPVSMRYCEYQMCVNKLGFELIALLKLSSASSQFHSNRAREKPSKAWIQPSLSFNSTALTADEITRGMASSVDKNLAALSA